MGACGKIIICYYGQKDLQLVQHNNGKTKDEHRYDQAYVTVTVSDSTLFVLQFFKDEVFEELEAGRRCFAKKGGGETSVLIHQVRENVQTGCLAGNCLVFTTNTTRRIFADQN